MKKRTSIFKQIIVNVIISIVLALLLLGTQNYYRISSILEDNSTTKNSIITDEIKYIMEFQDFSLNIIEQNLDKKITKINDKLIQTYFANTDSILSVNLNEIQQELGINQALEDIYVIDAKTGLIINTTFEKDKNVNVFNFGEAFKKFLLGVVNSDTLTSERFSIETKTNRIKKYTYQSSLDKKYIIETGNYSQKADEIKQLVQNRFNQIINNDSNIVDVDFFIGADNPFSLINGNTLDDNDIHKKHLKQVFKTKSNLFIEEGKLKYDYIFMERQNTKLYNSSVIRIVSDKSNDIKLLQSNLTKTLLIFGIAMLIVLLLIYYKARQITKPIIKLVSNVKRITNGNLNERADVEGNNEITTLSEKFNNMIETIESYYNELELKVEERTAEISKQKLEIEQQNSSLSDKNKKIETAFVEIEIQKRRITDSIIYAQRIQEAILPPSSLMDKLFDRNFVLFKPKEIVSGDFYWLNEFEDRIYIAAIDCTGHGVPGAFMSMIGFAFLNEIVNKNHKILANEVLFELRENIIKSLRQNDTRGGSKDGMDMSLCVFNKHNRKIEFAGAHNPLYVVRANTKEVEIYKADKMPIGLYKKGNLPFTNNIVELNVDDTIYLFSDGYIDQFGGAKKRKFMSKNFKLMLTNIAHLPMTEQKTILNSTIENWRGNIKQLDDILVIGIKA